MDEVFSSLSDKICSVCLYEEENTNFWHVLAKIRASDTSNISRSLETACKCLVKCLYTIILANIGHSLILFETIYQLPESCTQPNEKACNTYPRIQFSAVHRWRWIKFNLVFKFLFHELHRHSILSWFHLNKLTQDVRDTVLTERLECKQLMLCDRVRSVTKAQNLQTRQEWTFCLPFVAFATCVLKFIQTNVVKHIATPHCLHAF